MGVCSKCKQNAHFTVKDAQQICGRCGATTTIAILQTEDFKGIKIKRNYISEKKEKRVTQDKSSMKHIEENWGIYLEGFQRALRESIRQVKNRLDLNEQFEEKAKYYWFEYLKVFSEKRIGLVSFFTVPRQGSHGGEELGSRKRYESKYGLKTSLMDQIDQEELEEEFDEETSEDLQDADFVEKILRQKNTQDMQTQIMEENKDIHDFFSVFADEKRVQDEDRGFESLNNTTGNKENESNNNTNNRQNQNQSSLQMNQETQNQKAEMRGIVKSEMAKYNILEQQQQEQLDKLDQKRRKKRRMKGRINYIENEEECSKNYFNLVLDRSEDYVKCLYNGFRAAYIHMINLQSPLNSHPLKKIHALKQTSNGYSISREFIQAAIIQRNIPFAQNCDRIDIFHLIWAWDWAVFISTISQEQFTPKESIQHVYEYLDRINQLVGKQLKEHKAIQADLAKRKQQLSKTKKMFEIKKKLVESQKARTAKKNNKNHLKNEDENTMNSKNPMRGNHTKGSGYLSGSENEDDDTFVNKHDGEFDFMNAESNTRNEQLQSKIQATPKLQAKGKMLSQLEYENLDLNNYANANIFGNLSLAESSRFAKSDEREDQEKGIEELEFQFTRFQAKRSLALDEDQLLTLQVILQEILNEKEILIKRSSTPKNSVLKKKKTSSKKKKIEGELSQNDNILPLEYNLIPTIIYVSLYSLGYTYSPQKISNWMKNGVLAYNQGMAPFLNKILSPKDYWITPHSIPSSTFIRSQAKRFVVMTNHAVNVSKKRLFKECMQIISDFSLPFDWSCMVYLITISISKITEESDETKESEQTECFDCDLLVAGAFIVLLKMIYGLNDELFGVLLSTEVLNDAKEELTEQQYSTLRTIVTMFQRTTFKKTTGFYQEVPSFKNVAMNIQKYLDREVNQSRIELHSYSELIGVSVDGLSSLLQVFLESRKREMIIHKQNNPSKYVLNTQQQSQKISSQAMQMQYDEIEDELAIIRFFKLQLNMISDNGLQNLQFNCSKYEEFKKEREFSGLLEADIKFIDANVIRNGKSLAPPSFDYVLDKKYQAGYISQELQFIADKIAIYTGETTEKILGYLQKVESKLRKSVMKNTKKLQMSNSSSFYDIISDKIKQSSKRQISSEFSQ